MTPRNILLVTLFALSVGLYGCDSSSSRTVIIDEPVVEDPIVEDPIVDEPVVEDPIVDEPVVEDPIVDLTMEEEFTILLNDFRSEDQSCGRATNPVANSEALNTAARLHSEDMATVNFFSHTGSNGSHFSTRAGESGYSMWGGGENIAAGSSSFTRAFLQWVNSSGHCANLMRPGSTHFGIGYAFDSGSDWGHYWTFIIATGSE